MTKEISIPKARFFKTETDGSNRNLGLDIVRSLCIMGIFLAHTNNYGGKFTGIYTYIRCIPILAQELVFCLSGFLVGHQIIKYITKANSYNGLINFYKNRWIRTVPFYFIFLLINYIIFYAAYQYSDLILFKETSFSLFNYLTFTQNLISSHPTFFPEIWPLPIEEWSFLLIPIPIFVIATLLKKTIEIKHLLLLLLIEVIVITVFRIHYVIQTDPELDWKLRKIVVYRLDALLYGFIIKILIDNYFTFFTKNKLRFLIVGIIVSFGFYFSKPYLPLSVYNALMFSLIPIGMSLTLPYFYLTNFNSLPQSLKAIITHISLTSYAVLLSHLYLIQFSMLSIYTPLNLCNALLFTIIYSVIVIGTSTLFFNYIERPILMRRKKI